MQSLALNNVVVVAAAMMAVVVVLEHFGIMAHSFREVSQR
jgi:hypothetical protein